MTIVKIRQYSPPFPACNFTIVSIIRYNTPYDDYYNFFSLELDDELPLNFATPSVKKPSTLQKKID